MSLNDINNNLYNPSSQNASRGHEASAYNPLTAASKSSPFNQNEVWQKEAAEKKAKRKKKTIIIGSSVLILLVLIMGGIYFNQWWKKNAFHQDRVEVSFEGPKEADSTQKTKYIIHYKNNNYVSLKNVELQLYYQENFQPTDNVNLKYINPSTSKFTIPDIKPRSQGSIELNGIFYAPKNFPVFLRASLNFTPSNGAQQLSVENQISVNITAAPIMFSLYAPQNVSNGDLLEYVIDYKNLDIKVINNVQVRVDFPPGFQMESSDPSPSEKGSYWYIGNMESNQSGKITIKGRLSGGDRENKRISAKIGQAGGEGNFVAFSEQESNTRIVSPVLAISQTLIGRDPANKIINPGDALNYDVTYVNTGDSVLRNAIITVEIKGKALDFSNLQTNGGFFDGEKGIITWKASDVLELASIDPKETGKVNFKIPVKDPAPVENSSDKNFTVSTLARIDSNDIPTPIDSNKIIGSNRLELRLASKVIFDTQAYYQDEKMPNTGPIPLESGKETTFSVHWLITNVSNDVDETKIVSSLPSGVRWLGNVYPLEAKDNITYDERTNQVTWNVGNIAAGTGIISEKKEIIFQIGITPQINQVGDSVLLVNKSKLTGKDTFTKSEVFVEFKEISSMLPEDPVVGSGGGKVIK